MLSIGQFFKKIQNKHSKEMFERTIVAGVIQKHTNIPIKPEEISFSSDTIVIKNMSSAARSAIFIKKQIILKDISDQQSIKTFTNIR